MARGNNNRKRPWIKVLNRHGTTLTRCKDPAKAVIFFVRMLNVDGSTIFPNSTATKLLIDDREYNPPIRDYFVQTTLHPLQWGVSRDAMRKTQEDLEYLIDIHQAFYE